DSVLVPFSPDMQCGLLSECPEFAGLTVQLVQRHERMLGVIECIGCEGAAAGDEVGSHRPCGLTPGYHARASLPISDSVLREKLDCGVLVPDVGGVRWFKFHP